MERHKSPKMVENYLICQWYYQQYDCDNLPSNAEFIDNTTGAENLSVYHFELDTEWNLETPLNVKPGTFLQVRSLEEAKTMPNTSLENVQF